MDSDVAALRRDSNGVVRTELSLPLPNANIQAPVLTFESGEKKNAVEQVIYIQDVGRVLTLVLSAKRKSEFEKALPLFRDFAKSYRGGITVAPK